MEFQTESNVSTQFRLWLQSKLIERCRKNPRYSLRAFAAYLEMDASSVSQIISGKRKVSKKVITKICEKLDVSPAQLKVFLNDSAKKDASQLPTSDADFELLAEDIFVYISNWYHYAILELTFVEGFINDPAWIARTLSISVTESKMAIDRLIRLNLLKEEEGRLKKTSHFITNMPLGISSTAPQRELQRQVLELGLKAIDHRRPEEKDITSMTMAIDESKLPEARNLIKKFRRELCAFLEDGKQTRVFNLGIQLYPLSEKEE